MNEQNKWQDYLTANRDRFIQELVEFVKIPSISALSEHVEDMNDAGQWLAKRLKQAGLNHVQVLPTGGHPVVYGDWIDDPKLPTVMIYGHFDVQPIDPIDLWETPPFDPVIKNERMYGRGASDDKGNLMSPVAAIEALLKTSGRLPVNVKFFAEGQEEIGSPQLPRFVAENKDLLACDVVLSADGLQMSVDQPTIDVGYRGMVAMEVHVQGPANDLHSGLYGGMVQNPIHALAHIVASLHDKEGRVTVPGFYEDVEELSVQERNQMAEIPFDEVDIKERLQVDALFGETGYSSLERVWSRPTLEICGIGGGYQAQGFKGIVPAEAMIKLTCRLSAHQDPEKIAQAIQNHIANLTLPGVKVSIKDRESGAEA